MTVPIHVEDTGDRQFPATAAIATFVVILLAVAGLTIFETGFDDGGSSESNLRTREFEDFSPERARAAGARASSAAGIQGDRYGYLGPSPNTATASTVGIPAHEWALPDVDEVRAYGPQASEARTSSRADATDPLEADCAYWGTCASEWPAHDNGYPTFELGGSVNRPNPNAGSQVR